MKHVDVNLQILTYEISENSSPYINNDNSTAVCFFHPIALESQIQVCKSEHTLIFFLLVMTLRIYFCPVSIEAFSCSPGWTPFGNSCYHVSADQESWMVGMVSHAADNLKIKKSYCHIFSFTYCKFLVLSDYLITYT